MVFWADEVIELATEISEKMESLMADAPKDGNGKYIPGTPEIRKFNKYMFGLTDALQKLDDTNKY